LGKPNRLELGGERKDVDAIKATALVDGCIVSARKNASYHRVAATP
jgi:hypothetical protein